MLQSSERKYHNGKEYVKFVTILDDAGVALDSYGVPSSIMSEEYWNNLQLVGPYRYEVGVLYGTSSYSSTERVELENNNIFTVIGYDRKQYLFVKPNSRHKEGYWAELKANDIVITVEREIRYGFLFTKKKIVYDVEII